MGDAGSSPVCVGGKLSPRTGLSSGVVLHSPVSKADEIVFASFTYDSWTLRTRFTLGFSSSSSMMVRKLSLLMPVIY